jgi:hypothetical protein
MTNEMHKLVPKLHRSTILHHSVVAMLAVINSLGKKAQLTSSNPVCLTKCLMHKLVDYENGFTVWKGMIVYAYLSMLTGIVNYYLAYRLISTDNGFKHNIAKVACYVYGASLIVNWTYQVHVLIFFMYYAIVNGISNMAISNLIGLPLYFGLLYFIIDDDVILMKFLLKEINTAT